MSEAAAIIDIGREREQREVLLIHIVFQIEHARKSGASNLIFIPRTIGFLRTEQETQTALNTWPIEIATCTDAHDCPRCLRCRALANGFDRWVFVGGAGFTPATIIVLTALEPIASAQYPVMCHILANRTQAAQYLPGAINIIDAPATIPGTVMVLGVNQVLDCVTDILGTGITTNVTQQLERARGQVAAGWIENCVVIGKRHVFEPRCRHIFVECRPAAIPTLKAKLPVERAAKNFI